METNHTDTQVASLRHPFMRFIQFLSGGFSMVASLFFLFLAIYSIYQYIATLGLNNERNFFYIFVVPSILSILFLLSIVGLFWLSIKFLVDACHRISFTVDDDSFTVRESHGRKQIIQHYQWSEIDSIILEQVFYRKLANKGRAIRIRDLRIHIRSKESFQSSILGFIHLDDVLKTCVEKGIPVRLLTFDCLQLPLRYQYSDFNELFLEKAESLDDSHLDKLEKPKKFRYQGTYVNVTHYQREALLKGDVVLIQPNEKNEWFRQPAEPYTQIKDQNILEDSNGYRKPYSHELKSAGFWIRALTLLIDVGFALLLGLVGSLLLQQHTFWNHVILRFDPITDWEITYFFFYILIVLILMTTKISGSPGKWVCRLKVIRHNHLPIGFVRSCFRTFLAFWSIFFFGIGCLTAAFPKKKALHDWIAFTRVVYAKSLEPRVRTHEESLRSERRLS
ncbi:RDD family protein [Shouchella sp. 1P09AA]|uniref:RDD family protein n=1 Tax=unclassified Shouchella TaxID=2893065 RepID=UPI0039A15F13